MATETNRPMTVAERRRHRASIPHLDSGAPFDRFINDHGWPVVNATTACGQQIACTLVTRNVAGVRCADCRATEAGDR